MTTEESVCHVQPGDEANVAAALGGKFAIEDCGFFGNCDHKVEKFDFTYSSAGNYVEIWYCSTDWTKVGGALIGGFLLLYIIYRQIKARMNPVPYV